tara:strand:- start:4031 stop:4327 length:297 start_codon:yes stop_codon:yes gene_type:complete
MLDQILGVVGNNSTMLMGGGSAAIVLWVLKKVPNEHIAGVVETACESLGKVMTLGLAKWNITKKIWNTTIEPWFIDIVDNTIGAAVRGFIKGLRSDNK